MTTEVHGRFWTYYKDGQYPCTCFFCGNRVETGDARWYSKLPTPIYACVRCYDDKKIRPDGQEALPDTRSPQQKGHDENMESAKQTRNCIALLTTAIVELMKATRESSDVHAARTEILRKQLEEGKG